MWEMRSREYTTIGLIMNNIIQSQNSSYTMSSLILVVVLICGIFSHVQLDSVWNETHCERGGADEVCITACSINLKYSLVILYSSWSLPPTHSRVGIVLCVAVVAFDLSRGWDLLISYRDGLVGSDCTLTLVSKGDILSNSPVCGENNCYSISYDN